MKPFNLEEALAGKKIITRDGQQVLDIAYFPSSAGEKVAGTINGTLKTFCAEGKYRPGGESPLDLFMAPETKTVYANIYCSPGGKLWVGSTYGSWAAAAAEVSGSKCLGTYQATIEI